MEGGDCGTWQRIPINVFVIRTSVYLQLPFLHLIHSLRYLRLVQNLSQDIIGGNTSQFGILVEYQSV